MKPVLSLLCQPQGYNNSQKLAEYQKLQSSARMGDLMYIDTNNDGVLNDDDRVYAGSGMPDYELGLNFSADYRGFVFLYDWYASVGNEIINGTKIYTYQRRTNKELIYMWTPTNYTSTILLIVQRVITTIVLILICGLRTVHLSDLKILC